MGMGIRDEAPYNMQGPLRSRICQHSGPRTRSPQNQDMYDRDLISATCLVPVPGALESLRYTHAQPCSPDTPPSGRPRTSTAHLEIRYGPPCEADALNRKSGSLPGADGLGGA
ncbi:uncharacterized protein BP5553_05734 [Venustampulla echinocandica]|uniref:Uncharacterized protein n=1 Tax=Venustampulla echinocandica TaxID=2656787 RepID=A0A370TLG9_9HELO|nr:uncharacterized protein BP5553_05734 [Venustampulla echinocandica]RDL36382.1 hypothetical protein BP5553_05734 [Venustampulla echinocandica]